MNDNVIRLQQSPNNPPERKGKERLPLGSDYFEAGMCAEEKESRVDMFESTDEVNQMVSYFLENHKFRDAFLVVLGCNTGLRPEDLLEFRWCRLFNGDEFIPILPKIERKTQKKQVVYLNRAVREMAWIYRESLGRKYNANGYCFPSEGPRKGHVPQDWRKMESQDRVYSLEVQPMHVRSATRNIREAAKKLGLYRKDRRISCYSMRKTALSAPTGLVGGIRRSEKMQDILDGLHVAQLLGNHANLQTTLEHYVPARKQLQFEAYQTMNFGLEAIEEYKAKRGQKS